MEIAHATLTVSVDVDCPHCLAGIDLTKMHSLSEDGYIYKEILEGPEMGCEHFGEIIKCPECGQMFVVGKVEW